MDFRLITSSIRIVTEKPMERQSRWRDAAMRYRRCLRKHLFGQICRKCAVRKLEVWKNYGML